MLFVEQFSSITPPVSYSQSAMQFILTMTILSISLSQFFIPFVCSFFFYCLFSLNHSLPPFFAPFLPLPLPLPFYLSLSPLPSLSSNLFHYHTLYPPSPTALPNPLLNARNVQCYISPVIKYATS